MKKIIIKIMILLIAIMPIKTYAFGYTSFTSEDESVQVYIEGEDDEVYHYEEYTFEDVTETVKEDKELLTKIEEYGTLVKAFDTDFGIEETFEKYYTEFIINFDGKMDLPNKLALLVIDDDGNFIPGFQYGYDSDTDYKYYSFSNLYHDGRIIIIDPKVKTTYELQDEVAKLKFKDYKYKQYKENNMVFGRLSQVLGNDELVKQIAESKGLDVNEFLNKYGMDTTIAAMDEFSLEIDEELNRIIKNQNFLDSYGAFLVNPLFNTYDSISKIESSFDISVKIDDALKDYTDYSVYQLNSSVKVTSGVFEEGHDYYYYDPETKETEYIEISKYLTNAPILPSYHILETRGSMGYREVTTETFTAIANLIFGYYTYDGLNYNKIPSGSFNIGDKISSYGETVYIKDSYKLTEDTTFQEGKEYHIESSGGSYTRFTSGYPAYGSSIEEYISKTGYEIYCNKIYMELLKEHAYAEDEYLNFSYDYDEKLSQTPVFIVLGTSKEDAKKTISFDTNGGNNIISQEVILGEFATEPTAPTKTGYTFEAWYEDEELKTEFDFETHITKDVTLYAKWVEAEYTITLNTNDDNMGSVTANKEKAVKNTQITLTATPKTGYHFVKWESTDVDATTGQFKMPEKNVTVKAIFAENTYKIIFDKNGGNGSMDNVEKLKGSYKLPDSLFTAPDGKVFKGWSLTTDGEIITEITMNEDKTVYAIWEDIPEEYSYKFKQGDNQELVIDDFDNFTFTIDGDYSLFKNIKVGNLNLIKDEDYQVAEGSTIITFLKKGLTKLNKLKKGEYKIEVEYTNGKIVEGKVYISSNTNIDNPKTLDNINLYIIIGITSLIVLAFAIIYIKKHKRITF